MNFPSKPAKQLTKMFYYNCSNRLSFLNTVVSTQTKASFLWFLIWKWLFQLHRQTSLLYNVPLQKCRDHFIDFVIFKKTIIANKTVSMTYRHRVMNQIYIFCTIHWHLLLFVSWIYIEPSTSVMTKVKAMLSNTSVSMYTLCCKTIMYYSSVWPTCISLYSTLHLSRYCSVIPAGEPHGRGKCWSQFPLRRNVEILGLVS